MPTPPRREMVTVKTAVKRLGVKQSTVYLWLQKHPEVHRERLRLPDSRGHLRLTLAVDLTGLRDILDPTD